MNEKDAANASPLRSASAEARRLSENTMSGAVIFRDLPATFPEEDRYQRPSVVGSVIFHGFLISMVLLIPLLLPQSISERELLVTLVAPIGPPPPPVPSPVPKAITPTEPVRSPAISKTGPPHQSKCGRGHSSERLLELAPRAAAAPRLRIRVSRTSHYEACLVVLRFAEPARPAKCRPAFRQFENP